MILKNADFVISTYDFNHVLLMHSISHKLKCLAAFLSITGIDKKYFLFLVISIILTLTNLTFTNKVLAKEIISNASYVVRTEQVALIYIDELNSIRQRLLDWKESWEVADFETYLSFYRVNYSPKGQSHQQWLKNRRQRIDKNIKIQINLFIKDIYINGQGDMGTSIFTQSYRSNNYHDKVLKNISWKRIEGVWMIDNEVVISPYNVYK